MVQVAERGYPHQTSGASGYQYYDVHQFFLLESTSQGSTLTQSHYTGNRHWYLFRSKGFFLPLAVNMLISIMPWLQAPHKCNVKGESNSCSNSLLTLQPVQQKLDTMRCATSAGLIKSKASSEEVSYLPKVKISFIIGDFTKHTVSA